MKHMRYIYLLKALFLTNLERELAYKKNFFVEMLTSLAWGAFSILIILLLTTKVPNAFGWTREELILLTVIVNVIFGIYRVFFDINFWRFSQIIHHGELDAILLKPVDSQFQMSLWFLDFSALLRVLIAIGLIIYLLAVFHFTVSLISFIAFLFLAIASIILIYSLTFIVMTITIWFTKLSNLFDLVNTGMSTSKYPKEMYQNLNGFALVFLLPFVIVTSTPTKVLIQKGNVWDSILLIVFAVVLFTTSRVFWKFALRFYTSASG